jgi:hypothetical protein
MRVVARFALVAGIALSVAVGAPARAHAATPCWKKVINDWYDHSAITKSFPTSCLRQALDKLPPDLQNYSPIADDINAALLASLKSHKKPGGGSGDTGGDSGAKQGLISRILGAFGANGAHKMPLPLVLLAVLLLGTGIGWAYPRLARRLKTRPPGARPTPQSEQP